MSLETCVSSPKSLVVKLQALAIARSARGLGTGTALGSLTHHIFSLVSSMLLRVLLPAFVPNPVPHYSGNLAEYMENLSVRRSVACHHLNPPPPPYSGGQQSHSRPASSFGRTHDPETSAFDFFDDYDGNPDIPTVDLTANDECERRVSNWKQSLGQVASAQKQDAGGYNSLLICMYAFSSSQMRTQETYVE
ncbi:uncharacterized protein BDR25DRAFT_349724 [Lindgomyces ingoldianus]|uniref:Uncharacterized protein n=1 Tax=Lindgomyces ingoldianus TaxID=673940 RepID=A0ACB6RD16_9PLEO|nr:uncharacterized protein BDR25DRAFT_349724 [Lindgomyces ingoldianus]KAF2476648.1 hypothetical protein BDR25DRAFT_349724 [Lindgomyces ingoldianus]